MKISIISERGDYMIQGIDTVAKLTESQAAELRSLGYEFVGRYLVPQKYYKAITIDEAKVITQAGLKILTVWETTADRVKGGAVAGAEDGATALECARSLNMPPDGIIYFAVDYDALYGDFDTIEEYLLSARKQTEQYEIGVYGSFRVVEEMHRRKACKGFWQCVAWSYGKKSQYMNVYQGDWGKSAAGVPIDINYCKDMNSAGIWNYEDDNMKYTEENYKVFKQMMDRYEKERQSMPPDSYAENSCRKGIESGLFKDGNGDGSIDCPQAPVKRQELAAVLDRAGILDYNIK